MFRFAAVALTVVLTGLTASAADAPTGKWTRSVNGIDVTFEFGKEAILIRAEAGGNTIVVHNSYKIDSDGAIKLKVTKIEEKGNFPDKPAVGLETSFRWRTEGNKGILSDFRGVDGVQDVIEGEYFKQ